MTSSEIERTPQAQAVDVTDDALVVDLVDGRTIAVPLSWYPRLAHGTAEERRTFEILGRGEGIHWPELDEDISISGLLAGKRSGESQDSLSRWLLGRERAS